MEGIKEDTKSFSPYPLLVIGLILLAYALNTTNMVDGGSCRDSSFSYFLHRYRA